MKIKISLDEKEQQLIECIFEDRDGSAALDFVLNVVRPKVHEHTKTASNCGNIFTKSGEK